MLKARSAPPAERRLEGFTGQHLVVVPRSLIGTVGRHRLLRGLMPASAGHYPRARGHYVERPDGVGDLIVIACLSGVGWLRVDEEEHAVGPGEVVVIRASAPHAYGADADDPWTIVWAHAVGDDLPSLLEPLGRAVKLRLPGSAVPMLERVHQILEGGFTIANLVASASALRFALAEIGRLALEAATTGDAPDPVTEAIAWMRAHLASPTGLPALARATGRSAAHLSALFRKKTGYPPMDYFARMRIRRACELLDTTALQVKEIAALVGYDDPYYFSRRYTRIMHMSPSAYRKTPKG